ncbi:LysM peptidoglycan-binding domain-containing protein [Actinoplanes nipponensis]|uniref:LysM peptidoglycan-binding domain-containing protein n=1 Tax=Actinoplanes nipponensis TaxID=135950 RepID=UPI001EF173F1|nr:LysM domain-containing protein [Actinoplanes nipponensis]
MLTFFLLLASLASAVLWTTASRADDPPAGPPPTVVVQADDTLWDIAARTDPGRSPHAVAAEIRRLNGLGVDEIAIHAGDTLVVPRAR